MSFFSKQCTLQMSPSQAQLPLRLFFLCVLFAFGIHTMGRFCSGYVNSGSQDDAQLLFSEMSTTDLTTWSLMVRICAESCCSSEAIDVFREIQARGMRPNTVKIMNLLPVCAQLASLHLGMRSKTGKCCSLKNAYSIIIQPDGYRDLVMFTAMVAGYAVHGMGKEALMTCSHMMDLGIKPDHVSVYGMKPTMEQYGSVVDLLARGGQLDDAYNFVTEMPFGPNAT